MFLGTFCLDRGVATASSHEGKKQKKGSSKLTTGVSHPYRTTRIRWWTHVLVVAGPVPPLSCRNRPEE